MAAWAAAFSCLFAFPQLAGGADRGDDLTRGTIRLALAYYAVAVSLMLCLQPPEWDGSGRGRLARWCWTLACYAFLVHVAFAFHFFHHWSHADAFRHTEEVSGFGPGLFVSYFFTLAWTLDVAWWWLRPAAYAARPAWIGRTLHTFMAFIIFNGTAVFETGPVRVAGVALFAGLGVLWLYTRAGSGAVRRVEE